MSGSLYLEWRGLASHPLKSIELARAGLRRGWIQYRVCLFGYRLGCDGFPFITVAVPELAPIYRDIRGFNPIDWPSSRCLSNGSHLEKNIVNPILGVYFHC